MKSICTNDKFKKIKKRQQKFQLSSDLEEFKALITEADGNLEKGYNLANQIFSSTPKQQKHQIDLEKLGEENKKLGAELQKILGKNQNNPDLQKLYNKFVDKERQLYQDVDFKHLIY